VLQYLRAFARLELLCADDFGGRDDESTEFYEETRERQQIVEQWADSVGIRSYVADTDDKCSRHSDGYLYFGPSRVAEVLAALKEIGLPGDILDVPQRTSAKEMRRLKKLTGWRIQKDDSSL